MSDFEPHQYNGVCRVCGWKGSFKRTARAIRETYACRDCGASLRYRVQAEAILSCHTEMGAATLRELTAKPEFAKLKIVEAGTTGSFHRALSDRCETAMFIPAGASNEHGLPKPFKLPYADASVDLVVTSDIFEHVRKPIEAFTEVRRVLKPGGFNIFTVPTYYPMRDTTVERVDVSGAEDRMILDPVYHGDGKGGKLIVYNDFGRDVVGRLESVGFLTHIFETADNERFLKAASVFVCMKVEAWLLGTHRSEARNIG